MAAQQIPPELADIPPLLLEGPVGALQDLAGGTENVVGAAESSATAVPDFLSRLTSGNLWIRIGEVVAGLILLGIGLNAMLRNKPLQVVTSAAGVAGKAAMF